jgi:hypothetical protein
MRRLTMWVGLGCGLALLLFFYRAALFQGEQFGFRDAAHYYYPLYHKVQEEWNAGRWPLWDPSENAGMPLLGNPTAAVLYPLKVIYAILPYPWAARIYPVVHTALAFAGMVVLLRSWKTSWAGSMIAGISYAFGGPIVFQYCNIIFLVGASWIPWGLLAIDGWVRLKRPRALALLAVVLAMQVLGGDPESAYLLGLCGGGYAAGLAWVGRFGPWKVSIGKWVPLTTLAIVGWVAITLFLAAKLPGLRPEPGEKPWGPIVRWFKMGEMPVFRKAMFEGPVSSVFWTSSIPKVVAAIWGLAGLILVVRWRDRRTSNRTLVPILAGLAASAVLAGGLSAAQMVPAVEFTGLSSRATDESGHDMYPFSLEPYRLIELFIPGFFGRRFGQPVLWVELILPRLTHRTWVPSLYLGGLTAVLAIGSLGFRNGPPWRAWLTGIVVVSLLGSFGEFASPLTAARFIPSLEKQLGPLDTKQTNAVRLDGYLRNGDGSPYFLMSELLPGFSQFRFPSKLFTFTALALAALGGLGWDRAAAGRSKRLWAFALGGSALSLGSLAAVLANQERIAALFEEFKQPTIVGKLDIPGALFDIKTSLFQGAVVLGATACLVILARRQAGLKPVEADPFGQPIPSTRPFDLAGVLALLILSVDIGLVNAHLIRTVPQADFEFTPKVVSLIREAEKRDPSPGPFRVHRMPIWSPVLWHETISEDRVRDFVLWEHDTIQPKYGMLHGIEYTQAIGVTELYDYAWFFAPFPRTVRPEGAKLLGIKPGDQVVVYPRRGFDLWNSRYFILPALPKWNDVDRGTAAFLPQAERIYPSPEIFNGNPEDPKMKHWTDEEDFQILRNKTAFPRAWVVHDIQFRKPISGLERATRREPMEEILFSNDVFWQDPQRIYYDAKRLAWIEVPDEDRPSLARYKSALPPQAGESVKVVTAESGPQRTVLDVNLKAPGIVVLAEIDYPGWKLTIDGKPAPILRANRAMRGAAVEAGSHRLVYTYEPRSFQVGIALSLTSIIFLVGFVGWSYRRRV